MSATTSSVRPFDQGAASVKLEDGSANPYEEGSVEFGNFELGRAYALRSRPAPLVRPRIAEAVGAATRPKRRAAG